jgi:membrane associated rhomboid family serine protease
LDDSIRRYGSVPYFVTHPGAAAVAYQVPVASRGFFGGQIELEEVRVERPRPGGIGSLLTSIFLHGDIFHLLFNMLFLWIFGDNIEEAFGHGKFLVFYLVCGLGAALTHVVFHPEAVRPMVGASGAISGVLGAYILLYPRTRVTTVLPIFFLFQLIELPAFIFLGVWFLFQLFSLGSPSGVAIMAHVGGFVIGLALTRAFIRPRSETT